MSELHSIIWVCVDCMLHHANGECGSCHDDTYGHDCEPWSDVDQNKFHVTMGMDWEEHDSGCDALTADHPECTMGCETDTYSTSQCDGCGSYLHGERHAFTLWEI